MNTSRLEEVIDIELLSVEDENTNIRRVIKESPTAVAERCHLLEAPTEIRIKIYRKLFQGAQLASEAAHAPTLACGFKICSCKFPRHVVYTCRKLRSEALPYLLEATTLQLSSTMLKAVRLPPNYLSVIPRAVVLDAKAFSRSPFQMELFPSLRVLELRNITVWCKYHHEAFLESEEGNESMVSLAMYNLERMSSLLTELCEFSGRGFGIRLCCQFVVSSESHRTIHAVIDIDSKAVLQKRKGETIRDRNAWAGFY